MTEPSPRGERWIALLPLIAVLTFGTTGVARAQEAISDRFLELLRDASYAPRFSTGIDASLDACLLRWHVRYDWGPDICETSNRSPIQVYQIDLTRYRPNPDQRPNEWLTLIGGRESDFSHTQRVRTDPLDHTLDASAIAETMESRFDALSFKPGQYCDGSVRGGILGTYFPLRINGDDAAELADLIDSLGC